MLSGLSQIIRTRHDELTMRTIAGCVYVSQSPVGGRDKSMRQTGISTIFIIIIVIKIYHENLKW